LISRQKFLEYLEVNNTQQALQTLREEVAPVSRDPTQLHKLASLIMCTDAQTLHKRAKWDGAKGNSRRELINDLHKYIPASLMVPENRLEKLLLQAIEYQKERHMVDDDHLMAGESEISLLKEDVYPLHVAPRDTVHMFEDHTDEVWYAQFSPNGRYLATCSADRTALIYDLSKIHSIWKHLDPKHKKKFTANHDSDFDKIIPVTCSGHTDKVTFVSWNPTNDKLLTCSEDKTVKMWNLQGQCLHTFSRHRDSVCSAQWAPDGSFFISAGSGSDRTFYKWDSQSYECLSKFTADYRIHDFALCPKKGDRICAVTSNRIHVFHLNDSLDHFTLQEGASITCVVLSNCGRYALCSLSSNTSGISKTPVDLNNNVQSETRIKPKIHLWDLNERRLVKEFAGHDQTKYVLRPCFSAYPRRVFVCCGSESGDIYIWNCDDGTLVNNMPLSAHVSAVNCVCWNEQGRVMASASDDGSVRVWARIDRVKEI
jgi:WD40 repeat protein